MTENRIIANNGLSIVLYTTEDGNTQLEVKLEKDKLTMKQHPVSSIILIEEANTVVQHTLRN